MDVLLSDHEMYNKKNFKIKPGQECTTGDNVVLYPYEFCTTSQEEDSYNRPRNSILDGSCLADQMREFWRVQTIWISDIYNKEDF